MESASIPHCMFSERRTLVEDYCIERRCARLQVKKRISGYWRKMKHNCNGYGNDCVTQRCLRTREEVLKLSRILLLASAASLFLASLHAFVVGISHPRWQRDSRWANSAAYCLNDELIRDSGVDIPFGAETRGLKNLCSNTHFIRFRSMIVNFEQVNK